MARRSARVLGVIGTALVALVLSHSLVFLVRYGSAYGEALAHAGHDLAWTIAVVSSIGLGLGLALGGALQLRRLARVARRSASSGVEPRGRHLVAGWLTTSARLAATTSVLLTIQENVERAGASLPTRGVGLLLSPEYAGSLVVVAGVGLAVGLIVALFRWRRDVLIARLRSARPVARPASAAPVRGWVPLRPVASVLGRAQGLRAPPRVAAA